ncbi:MAG: hypothetical protein ACPG7F_01125 [Aggregatilineales bacterium]
MSDIIFCKTRHHYDSYQDLWALVELSGFETCYVDEIDPGSQNTYICPVLNGEWHHGWQQHMRAQVILWDLEWRIADDVDFGGVIPPGVQRVWASDKWYADQIDAEYVLLGSHPGLKPDDESASAEGWNVTFMAYMNGRRNAVQGDILRAGLSIAAPAWNPERHQRLLNTRAMLHVHQHGGINTVAPLRFALCAAYAMPLISETCHDPAGFQGQVLFSDYDHMADYTCTALRHETVMSNYGQALYQYLCEDNSFRQCVGSAL